MKRLLQNRSPLYVSLGLVFIYILGLSFFTRSSFLEAFFDVYIYVIVHILILYGIIWLADHCLQEQKPAVRTTIRIVFTVILLLAQFPFVITYLQELRYSNEALQWVLQQLRYLGFKNHRSAPIELYQLPWILMLGVMFVSYKQSNAKNNTLATPDSTSHESLLHATTPSVVQIHAESTVSNIDSNDLTVAIKQKTRRRLQTFGIFLFAFALFIIAIILGFAAGYSYRSNDSLAVVAMIFLCVSLGLFAWVGIRMLIGVLSFFNPTIPSFKVATDSVATDNDKPTPQITVTPEESTVSDQFIKTKNVLSEERIHLLKVGVAAEEIVANFTELQDADYVIHNENHYNSNVKTNFLIIAVLLTIIVNGAQWEISHQFYQVHHVLKVLSSFVVAFSVIYGIYFLTTTKNNKELSTAILLVPFLLSIIL